MQVAFYVAAVVGKVICITAQSYMNTTAVYISINTCHMAAFLAIGTALIWSGELHGMKAGFSTS